jgi:hypothetical protein
VHRHCLTAKGFVGQVPTHTIQGDIVVIIMGAAIPFILYQSGRGYRLLGQAYIHGIMNGEAFESSTQLVEDIKII